MPRLKKDTTPLDPSSIDPELKAKLRAMAEKGNALLTPRRGRPKKKSTLAVNDKTSLLDEVAASIHEEKKDLLPVKQDLTLKRVIENWQDLLLVEGQRSLEKMVELRDTAESEKIQFEAAKDILDRIAWDMRKSTPKNVNIFTNQSTDELLRSLQRVEALEKDALAASFVVTGEEISPEPALGGGAEDLSGDSEEEDELPAPPVTSAEQETTGAETS